MEAGFHELCNFGDVLEAGAGADQGADVDVEAVVVGKGEGECGAPGGIFLGGDEGDGELDGQRISL